MRTQSHRPELAAPPPVADNDVLITAAEARLMAGGISDMTLFRWLRRGIIPQPIVIERRRYWKRGKYLSALESAGEARQSQTSKAIVQEVGRDLN